MGDMPEGGTMTYKVVTFETKDAQILAILIPQVVPKGLPGFESYHSIQITYNFQVYIFFFF